MSILPQHGKVVDQLVTDLRDAAKQVIENPDLGKQGTTGMYGMVRALLFYVLWLDTNIHLTGGFYSGQRNHR